MKKNKRKLNKTWVFIMSATALLAVALLYNRLIPWQYKLGLFALAFIFMVFSKKRTNKIIKIVMASLMVLMSVFLFYTQSVASRIFTDFDLDKSLVGFVVLKESPMQVIADTAGKVFGQSDTLDSELAAHIKKDILDNNAITMNISRSSNDFLMLQSLYDGQIDVMILDLAYWETLEEYDEGFASKVRIIHEIEKDTLREEIVRDVRVDKDSFVVYISGIDIEGPITLRARSDVNMLMVVNPKTGKILTVAIPRDLYVPLACRNNAMDKLTHSGIYGVNCTVQTIENFLGININYYARLNFTSFTKIVDVLGGVTINNPTAFTSAGGVPFESGRITLTGERALAYVRERKAFQGGDAIRIQNQQRVLQGIIKKGTSPSSLLKIEDILRQVSRSVDTNMSGDNVQKLVRLQINRLIDWEFESAVISGSDAHRQTYSMPGYNLYVSIPNMESVNNAKRIILDFMDAK